MGMIGEAGDGCSTVPAVGTVVGEDVDGTELGGAEVGATDVGATDVGATDVGGRLVSSWRTVSTMPPATRSTEPVAIATAAAGWARSTLRWAGWSIFAASRAATAAPRASRHHRPSAV